MVIAPKNRGWITDKLIGGEGSHDLPNTAIFLISEILVR